MRFSLFSFYGNSEFDGIDFIGIFNKEEVWGYISQGTSKIYNFTTHEMNGYKLTAQEEFLNYIADLPHGHKMEVNTSGYDYLIVRID